MNITQILENKTELLNMKFEEHIEVDSICNRIIDIYRIIDIDINTFILFMIIIFILSNK